MVLAGWIMNNLEFDQMVLEYYRDGVDSSGWVHVSYVRKNRGEVLRFDGSVWTLGLQNESNWS
jgi:hypothetical protein